MSIITGLPFGELAGLDDDILSTYADVLSEREWEARDG